MSYSELIAQGVPHERALEIVLGEAQRLRNPLTQAESRHLLEDAARDRHLAGKHLVRARRDHDSVQLAAALHDFGHAEGLARAVVDAGPKNRSMEGPGLWGVKKASKGDTVALELAYELQRQGAWPRLTLPSRATRDRDTRERRPNRSEIEFDEIGDEASLGTGLTLPRAVAPVLQALSQSFAGGRGFTRDELAHELEGRVLSPRGLALSKGSAATRAGIAISDLEKRGWVTRLGRNLGPKGRPGPMTFALTRIGEERAVAQAGVDAIAQGEALAQDEIARREALADFLGPTHQGVPLGAGLGGTYRPSLKIQRGHGKKLPPLQNKRIKQAGYKTCNPGLSDGAEAWARRRGLAVPPRGTPAWRGLFTAWQRSGMSNPLETCRVCGSLDQKSSLKSGVCHYCRAIYGEKTLPAQLYTNPAARLDDWTKKHLDAWLDRTVRDQERASTKRRILSLLRSDPSLLASFDWPSLERASRPNPSKLCRQGRHAFDATGNCTRAGCDAFHHPGQSSLFGADLDPFAVREALAREAATGQRDIFTPRKTNVPVLLLGAVNPNPPARVSNPPPGVIGVAEAREHCKGFHDVSKVRWIKVQIPDGSSRITRKAFSGLGRVTNTSYEVPDRESNKHGPIWDHEHKTKKPFEAYDPIGHTSLKVLEPGSGPSDWWRDDRGPAGPWRR